LFFLKEEKKKQNKTKKKSKKKKKKKKKNWDIINCFHCSLVVGKMYGKKKSVVGLTRGLIAQTYPLFI
jgi:hypothetical protein